MLHERHRHLTTIAEVVEGAGRGLGSVVTVVGPFGSGRSAVLAEAGSAAERAGVVVLRARATAFEQGFTFGVARQLVELPHEGRADGGTDLDRLAGPGSADDLDHASDPATADRVRRAFEALLGELGARTRGEPTLIVVDDLQWADAASRHWLGFLGRRLHRLRMAIVASVLEGDGSAHPALGRQQHGDAVRLPVGPVSAEAAAAMVADRFGEAGEPRFLEALYESSSGVPMVLDALLGDAVRQGVRPLDRHADLVRESRPPRVRERLAVTIRSQPAPVQRLLRALATFGAPVAPDLVRRLAELDDIDDAAARDAARRLGLIGDDPRPRLAPYVGLAVDMTLSSDERRDLHLRAAGIIHDAGLGAERVAGHLMTVPTPAGPWTGEVLRAAAAAAMQRGDPDAAVLPLRHAILVAVGDEERGELLVELAVIERDLDMGLAVRRITQAVSLLTGVEARARALSRIPVVAMVDLPPSLVETVRRVAAELSASVPDAEAGTQVRRELALQLEARWRYLDVDGRAGLLAAVARFDELGGPVVGTPGERDLSSVLLYAAAVAGHVDARRVADGVRAILRHEPASVDHVHRPVALLVPCGCLADTVGELGPWLEIALDQARRRRAHATEAVICAELAAVRLCSGRRRESEEAVTRAHALLSAGPDDQPCVPEIILAPVLLTRSDPASVGRLLERYLAEERRSVSFGATMQLLRARLAMEESDFATALKYCLECGRRIVQGGRLDGLLLPWRPWAIDLARRLGHLEQARSLAVDERAFAERWGAPLWVGRSLRLLAGLEASPDAAEDLLERAVAQLRTSGERAELVAAMRELAAHRRRGAGTAAAAALAEEAECIADRLGLAPATGPWVSTAVPARPPDGCPDVPAEDAGPLTRLTPGERRVASLAAGGLTNQDIAEQLDVSVRAVEKHLTGAYRKLGLTGRPALAAMWDTGDSDDPTEQLT